METIVPTVGNYKLIDFGFYLIGDYACKKCAKERIEFLQTEIIPQILEEIKTI